MSNADDPRPPAAPDDDRGSWHLRGVGASVFAVALLLAGLGGTVLFSRDGAEVGWARLRGVPGTVTIESCAHSSSYALCYGRFDAADGSVHVTRLELRTLRHDQPGRAERTWLPTRTATHAWGSDVSVWGQLLPTVPFLVLTLVQAVWTAVSWRAWRRRRRARPEAAGTPDHASWQAAGTPGHASWQAAGTPGHAGREAAGTPAHTGWQFAVTPGHEDHPGGMAVGGDRRPVGWQDLRGTAAPPSPSAPHPRAGSQPWETSGHG
ncbi:hypothetical protein ACNTMW_21185 [Planosporangium sp. 12N6]|uniref:hypothetical protein n=1 Tax=Planosporangium spinosum TaxID=3402278 RepID=UPI003CE90ABB